MKLIKIKKNPVGAASSRPHFQQGITLIALIITIIIMLILAGIVISIMINGGLFEQAEKVKLETRGGQAAEESNLWKLEMQSNEYAKGIVMTAEEKIQELVDRNILTLDDQEDLITNGKYNNGSVTIGKHIVDFIVEFSEDGKNIPNPEDIEIKIAGVPACWTNQDANITVSYTGDISSLTKEIINVNGEKEENDTFQAPHNGTITVKLNHSDWSEPKVKSVSITRIDKLPPPVPSFIYIKRDREMSEFFAYSPYLPPDAKATSSYASSGSVSYEISNDSFETTLPKTSRWIYYERNFRHFI